MMAVGIRGATGAPARARVSVSYCVGWCLGAALLISSANPAHANDIEDRPTLLGSWGGERDRLSARGIDFDLTFSDEAAHNFSGGDARLTRAASQFAVGVTADLDKLWGIHHTMLAFVMTDRFGNSLDSDAHLGTSQQSQEIYGRGQTVWLTKLTLGRTFFDGRLELTAGRDSEGNTFDLAACNFQSLSLCGPQGPNLYGNYWMSYPGSVWMARAQVNTTNTTFIGFGVYQQNPIYYDASWESHNAWKPINPRGTDGVVMPLEFGWTPSLNGLEGRYTIGAMLNTGGRPDLVDDINGNPRALTGLAARQSNTSYNAYFALSQRISGTPKGEGVIVGLRAVAGDRATSALDRQMTVSLEYQNPFHRAGDRIGLGFASTHSSSHAAGYQDAYHALHPDDATVAGHSYEYISEIYYDWQALRSVSFQPNLQYVVHPGGSSQNRDVFVVGLRSSIAF